MLLRLSIIILLLSAAGSALVFRMVQLNVLQRDFLLRQGDARTLRDIILPAYRGMITDRNGEPLAISTPVKAIWINPKEIELDDKKLKTLEKLLHIKPEKIKQLVEKNSHREFVYLKRGVNPTFAARVKQLDYPGIYLKSEYRRFYPEADATAQLLGFTNIDDKGQEGIELQFDEWLQGKEGKKKVVKDRLGHVVSEVNVVKEPKAGRNLTLSIDRRIQYLTYHALANAMKEYKASSGSVVVLDVKTGEVLAMANQPSFNPNLRPNFTSGRARNRAVTDVFEPGSTIKALSVATALASGKYTPESTIDTRPGWYELNGNVVRDHRYNGIIDVTTVLQHSSNVGISKMILALPHERLWETMRKFGLGEQTESGFPGERSGKLAFRSEWDDFTLATLSFGYGLSVTNLQLAQSYAVIASGGRKKPVSLLKNTGEVEGEQIIEEHIANEILLMLEKVVSKEGTAKRAQVTDYRVSGKTGTVRMVGPNGYEKDHHIGLFIGIAPTSAPRLVISVVINDPKEKYYGGLVAAPVFAKVMSGSLRILGVPPDQLN